MRLGYRTRAEFHVKGDRIGYYALGTHDVVDLRACPLSHARLNDALARLRTCRPQESIDITVNPEGDDVLVWTRRADPRVLEAFPAAQHLKSREPRAQFIIDGVPVVNGCFSQSSLLLNRMLVATVHGYVLGGQVLDLYCGSGNLSLTLPPNAQVTGLDHNRAAVAAAFAQDRGDYQAGDADTMAGAVAYRAWDVIMLDPPRSGAKELTPALASATAGRLIYVSCDPATLARDCRALVDAGWAMHACNVLDMFPHTPHVECVCVLQRA
jgi:23S rRNA (uracil1939-C5)-methyltransferase